LVSQVDGFYVFMHYFTMRMQEPIWTHELLRHELTKLRLSQQQLAAELGASQSQISRVLAGHTSMSSKLARSLCRYVFMHSPRTARERISRAPELMDALAFVWDGSPSHASALAAVIRSLSVLSNSPKT
jgi:transcriptional regulator with XRE-family HTH domain